jgi:geranyl diphosphate synthase
MGFFTRLARGRRAAAPTMLAAMSTIGAVTRNATGESARAMRTMRERIGAVRTVGRRANGEDDMGGFFDGVRGGASNTTTKGRFAGFSAHAVPANGFVGEDDSAPVNPFKIVDEELRAIGERMRAAVSSDIPALSTASEYFFKLGAEGKRVRPTVLLLLASAMTNGVMTTANVGWRETDHAPAHQAPADVRRRQQRLAEIAEMIHVASLLHDDVLDNAATRRGLRALNLEVGNKLAILAGDFLLARASVTLASLRNTEVIELLSRVLEHLVAGEVMQMTANPESLSSMDHYVKKSFYKTASLIANSSKAIALLGGHGEESAQLAYEYGKNLGLAFQFQDDVLDFIGSDSLLGKPTLGDLKEGIATAPVLFAVEEFPELSSLVERRFKHTGDVQRAHELVKQSQGIERTKTLAMQHCDMAIAAIDALPPAESAYANHCRRALKELAKRAVHRSK